MLNAIRKRWAKAPDTPWRVFAGESGLLSLFGKTTGDIIHWAGFDSSKLANSKEKRNIIEAIASAPEDIAWLLARVEELEGALELIQSLSSGGPPSVEIVNIAAEALEGSERDDRQD